jgi:hypothetical protein
LLKTNAACIELPLAWVAVELNPRVAGVGIVVVLR